MPKTLIWQKEVICDHLKQAWAYLGVETGTGLIVYQELIVSQALRSRFLSMNTQTGLKAHPLGGGFHLPLYNTHTGMVCLQSGLSCVCLNWKTERNTSHMLNTKAKKKNIVEIMSSPNKCISSLCLTGSEMRATALVLCMSVGRGSSTLRLRV